MSDEEFSKYEKARILGARALQISMDAPILIKTDDEALSNLNFDPLRIAEIEFESKVLPISVNRPLPQKTQEKIKNLKIEVTTSLDKDEKKIEEEKKEEEEIAKQGEIMELANPEDERESSEAQETSNEQ